MELSIFVAKILAIFYLSMGIGVLIGQVNVNKMMDSFEKSQGLTVMSGFFMIVIGMLLVNAHNIWVKDWTVLITIVGWACLIKGIFFTAFPRLMFCFKGVYKYFNMQLLSVLVIAIGLLFGYFGFVMA